MVTAPRPHSHVQSRRRAPGRPLQKVVGQEEDHRGPFDGGPVGPPDERLEFVEIDPLFVGGVQDGGDAGHFDLGETVELRGDHDPRRVFVAVEEVDRAADVQEKGGIVQGGGEHPAPLSLVLHQSLNRAKPAVARLAP